MCLVLPLLLTACAGGAPMTSTTSPGGDASSRASGNVTLHAMLASWRLPAAVSRPVVVPDGTHILVLGGLVRGDVSTNSIVNVDIAAGTALDAGHLAQRIHDAGGTASAGGAFVFGGGETTSESVVQHWSPTTGGGVVGHLPSPRSDSRAVSVNGRSIILGGFDGARLSSDVLTTYDGHSFSVVGQLAQPVRYPAIVATESVVWLFGGETQTSEGASVHQTDVIQRFDLGTGTGTVVGHLPSALSHAMAFSLRGDVFVAGGRTGSKATDEILAIDTTNGTASPAGSLPQVRSDAGTAIVNGDAWLVGGEVNGPTDPLDTAIEVTAQ